MRFRKSVKSKRRHKLDDCALRFLRDSVYRHARPQFGLNLLHALLRSFMAQSSPEFLSFSSGEVAEIMAIRSSCS